MDTDPPFQVRNRLRAILNGMRQRCYNKNHASYEWYGAKGVKLCEEWRTSTEAFEVWARNNGYTDELTIDRIDPKSDYCPENCQWIPLSENARRAHAKPITAWGETKSVQEWAKDKRCGGMCVSTIRKRIAEGWEPEEAIQEGGQYFPVSGRQLINDTLELEAWGETKTVREWMQDERCAITDREVLRGRIKMGWLPEDILSRPNRTRVPVLQVTAWGDTKTLKEWIEDDRCVVKNLSTLHQRLWQGKEPEEALGTPLKCKNRA